LAVYLGGNYLSWLKDPIGFFDHVVQGSTATYFRKVFFPLGFLSFFSPSTMMLTVPILFQNLAARNLLARSTFFQYTTYLTPFVFVSAIYGFNNLRTWASKFISFRGCRTTILLVLLVAICSIGSIGKNEFRIIIDYQSKTESHFQYVQSFFKAIPTNISVRTHEVFAPHLANRKELHIYENRNPIEGASNNALTADYVILDSRFLGGNEKDKLRKVEALGYKMHHEHNGFYVYIHDNFNS